MSTVLRRADLMRYVLEHGGAGVINTVLNTVLQVGIVFLAGFIVWAIWGRKSSRFAPYVGLTGARFWLIAAAAAGGAAVAVALLQLPAAQELASGEGTVAAGATGSGPELIFSLILLGAVKTAFAEELLFRGLIGKRLIAAFGFQAGNAVQALLFGAVHLVLLLVPDASLTTVLGLVAFTTVVGWICGWLNEHPGRGSILPGWGAHAGGNVTAYLMIALG